MRRSRVRVPAGPLNYLEMEKPSWDKAPSWAQYLCQDTDGSWWWYEYEPIWDTKYEFWDKYKSVPGEKARCEAYQAIKQKKARRSLEQRPE